jgi:hypothetical protein
MERQMDHMTAQPSDARAVKRPRRDGVDPRPASWLAWGLWLLVVLIQGLLVAFLLGNDAMSGRQWAGALLTWVPFLAFATVGAMILARRPGNRIGWLCWAIGFTFTLSGLSSRHLWEVLTADQDWSAAWALAAQLGTMAWLGTLLGLLPFLILLFPTGRLLSRRWRLIAWTLGLVVGLYLTARLLMPGPVSPGLPANPLGVESAEGLLELLQAIASVTTPFLALAVVGSLVLRFRRPRGDERQQLKWLTYVVALDVVMLPALGRAAEQWAPLLGELVVFPAAISLIPIAIGVAVLKYRLYDIDRVINRTLVYGLLTVLLGAVYAAGVFAAGFLIQPMASPNWPWPPRPWPWPRCSSRLAAASKLSWIDASTAAAMTQPGPSRPSADACATRSSWTPSQPSWSRWLIKPCSPPLYRSGSNHRHRHARIENREETNCDADMTPCMPCSFGLLPHPRSGRRPQLTGRLRMTVTVRCVPLVTAAYGTRVARPARMTWLRRCGDGRQLATARCPCRQPRRVPGGRCRSAR